MLTEGGERDGVGGDGGTKARRGMVGGDGGEAGSGETAAPRRGEAGSGETAARRVEGDGDEAGSGETAARRGRGRRRRDVGEAEATRERRESGELGEEEEGISRRGGLGENRYNSNMRGENVLLLKSVVVAPFLEGRYYYT